MEKIEVIITDKLGKKMHKFGWHALGLKRLNQSSLTKIEKNRFKKVMNNILKEIKDHFKKEEAYPLDAHYYMFDIINEYFGMNIDDLILEEICKKINLTYFYKNNKVFFKNEKEKVFYNPDKNKIYIATQGKSLGDVQLGDL